MGERAKFVRMGIDIWFDVSGFSVHIIHSYGNIASVNELKYSKKKNPCLCSVLREWGLSRLVSIVFGDSILSPRLLLFYISP